jgi:hypothetical protein
VHLQCTHRVDLGHVGNVDHVPSTAQELSTNYLNDQLMGD